MGSTLLLIDSREFIPEIVHMISAKVAANTEKEANVRFEIAPLLPGQSSALPFLHLSSSVSGFSGSG